ncbi:NUDIX hydrolase [Oryzibacter oryziterrae]|uniref:NUDIX hydrolase n=1 Tax=Oryzibacter oryziterrae TaxID=2766474 RepID=UPI001F245891|nr:NUDIX domain-containing protein [Oryzibacter oryziterrae]
MSEKGVPTAAKPKTLVPRDAATLLVLDRTLSGLHVLMGKRRDDLAFNPGAYVFPGGAVDPEDGLVSVVRGPTERTEQRLCDRMRGKPSRRRAKALLVAALRETVEETGYVIGPVGSSFAKAPPEVFSPFVERQVGLDLSLMTLVGRAITPVKRPRRFDARFFALWADAAVTHAPSSPVPPDNELSDVRFISLEATLDMNLHHMTKAMLKALNERLDRDPKLTGELPAPFYVPVGDTHRLESI